MAIMQSCCCWRSVRRGSFACAVYTVMYYSLLAVTLATVLQEESQHAEGNDRTRAASNSILEPEASPATMSFNMALLACSSCGVICCLLLLYGLFKDEKLFLVPWICIVIACSLVDVAHLFYLFFVVSLAITPTTAMVLTIDFFLLCLNVYSVLCVISQYQEYAAGRGMASDDCEHGMHPTRTWNGKLTVFIHQFGTQQLQNSISSRRKIDPIVAKKNSSAMRVYVRLPSLSTFDASTRSSNKVYTPYFIDVDIDTPWLPVRTHSSSQQKFTK
ncbi:unnamed protein product [Trichogramma brassicae]|uniref:Uncharacterized protein n=1 Tax=Trichogramma brassicae TaxID=86971 RepID=A0A6H5IZ95_9HYME|nr:unnamed protein product [Trichogramma brassicae]